MLNFCLTALENRFSKNLEFGIGAVQGIMIVGMNRINTYKLSTITLGLLNPLYYCFLNQTINDTVALSL